MKKQRATLRSDEKLERLSKNDQVAFDALRLPLMQRAIEAIDVDMTGFVTVASINRFTSSRPSSWRYGPNHIIVMYY